MHYCVVCQCYCEYNICICDTEPYCTIAYYTIAKQTYYWTIGLLRNENCGSESEGKLLESLVFYHTIPQIVVSIAILRWWICSFALLMRRNLFVLSLLHNANSSSQTEKKVWKYIMQSW